MRRSPSALRWPFLVACMTAVLAFQACVESSTTRTGGFDKKALVAHLGEKVLLATYLEFETSASKLGQLINSYATSLSEADRDAARQGWRDAMTIWQKAELMQVGPAGAKDVVAGGQDLRDSIYSSSTVNPCRIDQELVEGNYSDASSFAGEHVNVRGLDALEYLLFSDGDENACPPQNVINASGGWDGLTDLPQRRADYASTVAQLLLKDATSLTTAWKSDGGNYLAEFVASPQIALNAISDAMLYLDTETKDMKVAVPAGLSGCDTATCPQALESQTARYSKQEIRANLVGFQLVFTGGADGLGFDDWLAAVGAADLATKMTASIASAIEAVDAIEEDTLEEALAADLASVEALYQAIKTISDDLKSRFVTVLDLDLANKVEGDND